MRLVAPAVLLAAIAEPWADAAVLFIDGFCKFLRMYHPNFYLQYYNITESN